MKIKRAASSESEVKYMHAALADFSRDGARAEYAAWLKSQGRETDARAVLSTIDVFHSLDANALDEFESESPWARMIAIPLLKTFISTALFDAVSLPPPTNLSPQQLRNWQPTRTQLVRTSNAKRLDAARAVRDMAFPWLRPALSLSFEPAESEPKLGESYLWGSPDIPEGESWPKISELSDEFGCKKELPQDHPCAFVGQIAFSDLQGTVLGHGLPTEGGFAVFKITEPIHLGIHEALVRSWNNKAPLKRHQTPQELIEDKLGDSCNCPHPPHVMILEEVLSVPWGCRGPYSEVFPNCSYDEELYDAYSSLRDACEAPSISGFGGYLRPTTGDDPSPDTDSLRFVVLHRDPDGGTVHFSVPAEDLKEGRLDRVKNVWCDWD